MSFVDPFLLTVTLVMTVILIVGNIYFVAKYAHPADSAFGSSTACKAVIVKIFSFTPLGGSLHLCWVSDPLAASGRVKLQRRYQRQHEDLLVHHLHELRVLHRHYPPIRALLLRVRRRSDIRKTSSLISIETKALDCSQVRGPHSSHSGNSSFRFICRIEVRAAAADCKYMLVPSWVYHWKPGIHERRKQSGHVGLHPEQRVTADHSVFSHICDRNH